MTAMTDEERVLDAMRSGEWLRTQWIMRVAFNLGTERPFVELGDPLNRTLRALRRLHARGLVERRDVPALTERDLAGWKGKFEAARREWRLHG